MGGVPAKVLTDKVRPFVDLSLEQKLALMRRFVDEFAEEVHPGEYEPLDGGFRDQPADGSERFTVRVLDELLGSDSVPDELGVVYAGQVNGEGLDFERLTVFDISTKQYSKLRTGQERQIIKFMNGYRARFAPRDRPRIEPPSSSGRLRASR